MNSLFLLSFLCLASVFAMLATTTPCNARVSLDTTTLLACPVLVRARSNVQLQDSSSSSTPAQDRLLLIPDNKQLRELHQHELQQLRSETARRKLDQSALNHANAIFHASIIVAFLAMFSLVYLVLTTPKAEQEVFKELDSLLLEESEEDKQLLEAFDQEVEVEEVSMMPLVMDSDPVKKPSSDDVNWPDCTHANKADSLDEDSLTVSSQVAVDSAPLFEAPRQLEPGSVLTYDDVDWDKFPYAARARIFYLITNESMTAADLQVFEAELESTAEAASNEDESNVVRFQDVQLLDHSLEAQIHQSISENDGKVEPEPQLRQFSDDEELELRYVVTIDDVDWDALPLSMRLKVFYLVAQEKLTLDELIQLKHEANFEKDFVVVDEKTQKLEQLESLPMESVCHLCSDDRLLEVSEPPDDCPLQIALTKKNLGFDVEYYSSSNRAQIYQCFVNFVLPSQKLFSFERDAQKQMTLASQMKLNYNVIDLDSNLNLLANESTMPLLEYDENENDYLVEECDSFELLEHVEDSSKIPRALKRCQSSAEELSLAALSTIERLSSPSIEAFGEYVDEIMQLIEEKPKIFTYCF